MSLFVEPLDKNAKPGMQGPSRMGAVHAYGARVDGHQVTSDAEVEKGFAWGELRPIVSAMGWDITRRAVPGGQQILITRKPLGYDDVP